MCIPSSSLDLNQALLSIQRLNKVREATRREGRGGVSQRQTAGRSCCKKVDMLKQKEASALFGDVPGPELEKKKKKRRRGIVKNKQT